MKKNSYMSKIGHTIRRFETFSKKSMEEGYGGDSTKYDFYAEILFLLRKQTDLLEKQNQEIKMLKKSIRTNNVETRKLTNKIKEFNLNEEQ